MNSWYSLITGSLASILPRLALDVVCTGIVVSGIYLRRYPRRDYAFTYWLLNLVTFAVAAALSGVRVEMGLSLGLFAVFGIMRYRTEAMRIRDLTYLFVSIGMAILNGVASTPEALSRVAIIDVAVIVAIAWFEFGGTRRREDSVTVRYDRLELLDARRKSELIEDLSHRLGVRCQRVFVQSVDLMHDSVELVVTFRPAEES